VLSGPKADLTQFAGDAIVNAANERCVAFDGAPARRSNVDF
jgi:O-acetyl-ADP-ribose deacetylase (regulator of RNase III)